MLVKNKFKKNCMENNKIQFSRTPNTILLWLYKIHEKINKFVKQINKIDKLS